MSRITKKNPDSSWVYEDEGNIQEQFSALFAIGSDEYPEQMRLLLKVLESIPEVFFIMDMESRIIYANPAYTRVLHLPLRKIVGKKLAELEPKSTALDVIRTGKPFYNQFYRINHLGVEIIGSAAPIYYHNQQIGVSSVFHNLNDMLNIYYRLDETLEHIQSVQKVASHYFQEIETLRSRLISNSEYVFESPQMKNVLDLALKVAAVDSTVLLIGESGVGKDVVAKIIHKGGFRSKEPFLQINCAAIPETLLESELFGYESGSFTGASRNGKLGLFEAANGGTVFLDEIGEMSMKLQGKLLQVLQSQEITRIGSTKATKVNVRIITATNKQLEKQIEVKQFREDLYYRLNVVPIRIPPLRERKEDIIPLALHFLKIFNTRYGFNKIVHAQTLKLFEQYSWPGNIRELENVIQRIVVASNEQVIRPNDEMLTTIQKEIHKSHSKEAVSVNNVIPLKDAREMVEKELIIKAYQQYKSITKVAEVLEVDYSTILRKIQRYGLS